MKLITLQDIIYWIIQESLTKDLIKNLKKYDSALKVCVYCNGKNHIWTHCNTNTHIETGQNVLKKAGRFFLMSIKGSS